MEKRIENILAYIYYTGRLNDTFGEYSRMYAMSTENIKDFVNIFNLTNKKVLSVAGSGDQMLNCVLKGCRNIALFDISPLAFYQVKLKKEAIINLNFYEFMDFFNISNYLNSFSGPRVLNYNLFQKISSTLDKDVIDFFEKLYKSFDNEKELYDHVYFKFYYSLKHMNYMNNYMNEDSYIKLKNILINKDIKLSFIESDINSLGYKLDNKYDLILFSNISDYINNMYHYDPLNNYHQLIDGLSLFLNDYGMMQVGYIYNHFNTHFTSGSDFCEEDFRKSVFIPNKYHTITVNAYEDSEPFQYHDKIITYQKLK